MIQVAILILALGLIAEAFGGWLYAEDIKRGRAESEAGFLIAGGAVTSLVFATVFLLLSML